MKRIFLFFVLTLVAFCELKSQVPFKKLSDVSQYITDSIKKRPDKINANTINKAYQGIIQFVPDVVQDTADVSTPYHGYMRFQRKDSTAYIYDTTLTPKRWRVYVNKFPSIVLNGSSINKINTDTSSFSGAGDNEVPSTKAMKDFVQAKAISGGATDTIPLHNQIVALQNGKLNIGDTAAKWVGRVYKRSDSFFYKTGAVEYFIGKDSIGMPDPGVGGDGEVLTSEDGSVLWANGAKWNGSFTGAGTWLSGNLFINTLNAPFLMYEGVANGSATLPAVSGGFVTVGRTYTFKNNTSTSALCYIRTTGSDEIYFFGELVDTVTLNPGESISVIAYGAYWIAYNYSFPPRTASDPLVFSGTNYSLRQSFNDSLTKKFTADITNISKGLIGLSWYDGSGHGNISNLLQPNFTTLSTGQLIRWDGSQWGNWTPNFALTSDLADYEAVANKATDFSSPSNTTYPTTLAVQNALDALENDTYHIGDDIVIMDSSLYAIDGGPGVLDTLKVDIDWVFDHANTDMLAEGSTNKYFTNALARAAISLTTTGTSGAASYNSSTGVLNIPQYTGGGSSYTFNDGVTESGGTVKLGGSLSSARSLTTTNTNTWSIVNNTDNASVQALDLEGDRATMADGDEVYVTMKASNDAGTQTEIARMTWVATDVNVATNVDGAIDFSVMTAGTLAKELRLTGASLTPSSDNGLALGTSTVGYTELNIGNGGQINFDADVQIRHSNTNELKFENASLYYFDNDILPFTNNIVPLGNSTRRFSDLSLGDGGFIDIDSRLITENANGLTMSGGDWAVAGYYRVTQNTSTDNNYTVTSTASYHTLIEITAARTVTFPTATAGRELIIHNQNSSGNAWNISGTVQDAAGASVTTIPNDSVTRYIANGSAWIKL